MILPGKKLHFLLNSRKIAQDCFTRCWVFLTYLGSTSVGLSPALQKPLPGCMFSMLISTTFLRAKPASMYWKPVCSIIISWEVMMFTHQKTSWSFLFRLSRFKNVVTKDWQFSTKGLTFARPWSYLLRKNQLEKISSWAWFRDHFSLRIRKQRISLDWGSAWKTW